MRPRVLAPWRKRVLCKRELKFKLLMQPEWGMLRPVPLRTTHERGSTEMRNLKRLATTLPVLLTFLCMLAATPASAQGPRYLHALANLRQARGWIQADRRPEYRDLRAQAIDEINKAISEVGKAVRDDGRNPNWTPPPNARGASPMAPIASALHLLDDAHGDVAAGQDAGKNLGLQVRALQHIDAARQTLHQIRRLSGAER